MKVLRGKYEEAWLHQRGEIGSFGVCQYDIGEEEILTVMESAGKESRLYYKLQDLLLLYRGFSDYLKAAIVTKEELLDVLCRGSAGIRNVKKQYRGLDGFTGFTPVQNRLLLELLKHCRKVCVTVTMDDREIRFPTASLSAVRVK